MNNKLPIQKTRRVIIFLLLLLFTTTTPYLCSAQTQFSWVKASNKNAFLEFPQIYINKYKVLWFGQTIMDEASNRVVITGTGSVVLKDKITGFQTGKISCEFDTGILISNININDVSWFRYIDDQQSEIELELDETDVTFRGSVTFDSNKLIVESLNNGILVKKHEYYYKGTFKNNKPDGYGTICYGRRLNSKPFLELAENDETPQPLSYEEGYWIDGKLNEGFVRYVTADGVHFEGFFKDDVPQGWGKYFTADECSYFGEFKDGNRSGYGRYQYVDGSSYEGHWENNQKSGYGELSILSQEIEYRGNFANGDIEGKGIIIFKDGLTYTGEFIHNAPNGQGIITNKDGECFKALFENGTLINLCPLADNKDEAKRNFSIYSFFVSTAQASFISECKEKLSKIKKSITDNFNKVKIWTKENKEHVYNLVKG